MPTQTFTIENTRLVDLILNEDSFELSDTVNYSIDTGLEPDETINVESGQTFSFDVEFHPQTRGVKNATIKIISNLEPLQLNLTGTGLSPGSLEQHGETQESCYDYQVSELNIVTRDINVRNTGDIAVSITGITQNDMVGDGLITFDLEDLPISVASGAVVKIGEVSTDFTETDAGNSGSRSIELVVNGGSGESLEINCTVEVLETNSTVAITPATIAFGSVQPGVLGTFSGTARLEASEDNALPITISSIETTGGVTIGSLAFPITLQPGQVQNIVVNYQSEVTDVGLQNETITPICSNNSFAVMVSADVTATVNQVKNISYQMLNSTTFPNRVPVGMTHSLPRQLRVTASSANNVDVTITPPEADTNFSCSDTDPVVLEPGQSHVFNLNFHPSDFTDGVRLGSLTFISDGSVASHVVNLVGTGNVATFGRWLGAFQNGQHDVNSVNNPFGSGVALASLPLFIDNRQNDYALTISEIFVNPEANVGTLSSEDLAEFQLVNSLPLTIPAGSYRNDILFKVNPGGTDVDYITQLEFKTAANRNIFEPPFWIRSNSFSLEGFKNSPIQDVSPNRDANGNFVLESGDINVWQNIVWRNTAPADDGANDVEMDAVLCSMYHNVPDDIIPFSQELVQGYPDELGSIVISKGLLMYDGDTLRPIWPELKDGGRHPNNTYWQIDQTQQSLGGNNYQDWVIPENSASDIQVARVRFIKPNPPPMFLVLVSTSGSTWRIMYSFRVV